MFGAIIKLSDKRSKREKKDGVKTDFHPSIHTLLYWFFKKICCSIVHALRNTLSPPINSSNHKLIHSQIHLFFLPTNSPSIYLFNHLFIHLSICSSIYSSIHSSIHLSNHSSIHLSNFFAIHSSIHCSIHSSIYSSIHIFIHLFIY